MLYFYLLASLALLFSGAVAQECNTFTPTWTGHRVCTFTYNTTASNTTAGDALSALFRTSTSSSLPSRECAQAYSSYYCNVNYPECNDGNNNTRATCVDSCQAVLTACSSDSDSAFFVGTDFPLPDCSAPTDADCSVPQPADLSVYYSECSIFNRTDYVNAAATVGDNLICQPHYPIADLNRTAYYNAARVFMTFRSISSSGYVISEGNDFTMYPCAKYFAQYYCHVALAPCSGNQAPPPQRLCADACTNVTKACADYIEQFAIGAEGSVGMLGYNLPTADECDALPTVDCYDPQANDTTVQFFFGGNDPPVIIEPTQAPPSSSSSESSDDDTPPFGWPPQGPGVGGGLGAGVLIGLLLIIGIIMLIMKKQDSR